MTQLILEHASISGLPRHMYEGKVIKLQKINYFFGPNGAGKTLSLKKVTERAKAAIQSKKQGGYGFNAGQCGVGHVR
jgi:flagellar biosynthesis GTPase FlhF